MFRIRLIAIFLLVAGFGLGFFIYDSQVNTGSWLSGFPFKLGLDLKGGTHLVYKADLSKISAADVNNAMTSLREVIERRVNSFGVSEPIIQTEEGSILSGSQDHKLIVELPGVTDVSKAIDLIGKTPLLEFKLEKDSIKDAKTEDLNDPVKFNSYFEDTGLTGRFLDKSQLDLSQTVSQPAVSIKFNSEGKDLFAKITKANVGRVMAIFLDGQIITNPVIKEEIRDGKAQISGNFTIQAAQELVKNLNYGALPVPIELISTQTIGSTLGEKALNDSVKAGTIAFIVIAIFLIIWYRLPGIIAVLALVIYVSINLALFKLLPGPLQVTLTAAGIAGFILSIGMAVDANILIFERTKEEMRKGKTLKESVHDGFARAWLSIRDSNLSSIITAVILFFFASTAVIKGFAFVFGLGVVTSMFTAITVSRTLLMALGLDREGKIARFLFSNGFNFKK